MLRQTGWPFTDICEAQKPQLLPNFHSICFHGAKKSVVMQIESRMTQDRIAENFNLNYL